MSSGEVPEEVAAVTVEVGRLERTGGQAAAKPAAVSSTTDFEALYAAHFGPLSGYAQALVGDPTAAVDVAQEAFTRLLSRWRSVRDPRAWLFYVATNVARDHWRQATRDRELTDRAGQHLDPHAAPHDPWLRDLVDRLPTKQREAVLLHYYADIPVDQVARLLHVPTGTVKRRLHDARLRLALAAEGDPR